MSAAESLLIRPERPADADAVTNILTQAFGQSDEASLVTALHRDGVVRLSLLAELAGEPCGQILYSELQPLSLRGVALAPLAVLPEHQAQGIGSALIRASLEQLCQQGWKLIVVLGDPAYYTRFGFSTELGRQVLCPYSGEHLMALELVPGALMDGPLEIAYPQAFSAL